MASQRTLAICKSVCQSFAPLRLGMGVPQIVGHALAAGIAAEPGCVMVQLDLQKACNTLSRQRMLEAVAQRCQSPPPFGHLIVQHPFASPAAGLCCHHASTQGVCQGDPCRPLVFALALQGLLEELQELDLARPLA
jgi:hypothetical protein